MDTITQAVLGASIGGTRVTLGFQDLDGDGGMALVIMGGLA